MEPINVKKFSKIPEQAIIFNMCNEPATKYSLLSIADKSSDPEGKNLKFMGILISGQILLRIC